jgi:hypothetical protein
LACSSAFSAIRPAVCAVGSQLRAIGVQFGPFGMRNFVIGAPRRAILLELVMVGRELGTIGSHCGCVAGLLVGYELPMIGAGCGFVGGDRLLVLTHCLTIAVQLRVIGVRGLLVGMNVVAAILSRRGRGGGLCVYGAPAHGRGKTRSEQCDSKLIHKWAPWLADWSGSVRSNRLAATMLRGSSAALLDERNEFARSSPPAPASASFGKACSVHVGDDDRA